MPAKHPELAALLQHLRRFGLLLKTDPQLPSAVNLLAGERVRGSWWAHPQAHAIFRALSAFAGNPDVLVTKLLSAKDTFVHRRLWPAVLGAATSGERWQTHNLSAAAHSLFSKLGSAGACLQASGNAVRELETRLLVHAWDIHTASGAHARQIETWERWAKRVGCGERLDPAEARCALEDALAGMRAAFGGAARLPWHGGRAARA